MEMKSIILSQRCLIQVVCFLVLVLFTFCIIIQSTPDQDPISRASAENNSELIADNTNLALPQNSSSSQPETAEINSSLSIKGRWQHISDLPRKINSLVVDPGNPRIIYAGAGLQGSGSGVYKSEDAGLTWRLASKGLPSEDVNSLVIDPHPPYRLFASISVTARTQIYASNDGADSWTLVGNTGIFGGLQERLFNDPSKGDVLFLVIQPQGLFRSVDGGRNWQALNEGLPQNHDFGNGAYVLSLAVDPNNSQIIYAGTGGYVSGQGHGVFKSDDGGKTWSPTNRGMIDYRISALAIDPTNSQIIYAGSDKGELFKSIDSGQTWTDMSDRNLMDQYDSPVVQNIVVDSSNPETVYVLTDEAGFLVSYDAAASWIKLGRPEKLDDTVKFTASAIIFDPKPVLIVGVDPYIKNAGGWRFAAS